MPMLRRRGRKMLATSWVGTERSLCDLDVNRRDRWVGITRYVSSSSTRGLGEEEMNDPALTFLLGVVIGAAIMGISVWIGLKK